MSTILEKMEEIMEMAEQLDKDCKELHQMTMNNLGIEDVIE